MSDSAHRVPVVWKQSLENCILWLVKQSRLLLERSMADHLAGTQKHFGQRCVQSLHVLWASSIYTEICQVKCTAPLGQPGYASSPPPSKRSESDWSIRLLVALGYANTFLITFAVEKLSNLFVKQQFWLKLKYHLSYLNILCSGVLQSWTAGYPWRTARWEIGFPGHRHSGSLPWVSDEEGVCQDDRKEVMYLVESYYSTYSYLTASLFVALKET